MPFFHAEHLFEQKYALLEAEKLHKTHTDVQFLSLTHACQMTDRA